MKMRTSFRDDTDDVLGNISRELGKFSDKQRVISSNPGSHFVPYSAQIAKARACLWLCAFLARAGLEGERGAPIQQNGSRRAGVDFVVSKAN